MPDYRIIIESRDEDGADYVEEVRAAHASDIDADRCASMLDGSRYYTDAYRIERASDYVAGLWNCVRYREPRGVIGGSEAFQTLKE